MKRVLLLIVLFTFTFPYFINAQMYNDRISIYPKTIVKFSPISLLNLNAPTIQFSAESFIHLRKSIQYELGFMSSKLGSSVISNSGIFNTNEQNITGGTLRVEYHSFDRGIYLSKMNCYWGIGGQTKLIFRKPDVIETGLYKTVGYMQSQAGLYYTYGFQVNHGKHLMIDLGASGGVYFESQNQISNIKSEFVYRRLLRTSEILQLSTWGLLLNLNFKIGYSF